MRKHYLDNIRWTTVLVVVIYHVIYMYNGVQPFGVIGPFKDVQYQDAYQYLTFPWFMALLFVVSGISARLYLENHSVKEFAKSKHTKLLIPSTLSLFVFWWILGYYNMLIGGAFDTISFPEEVPAGVGKFITWFIMCLSGTGVLWYIQVLWIFSMILVLVRKFEKGKLYEKTIAINSYIVVIDFVIGCMLFSHVLNTPVVTVYRFGIYGFCYFSGYFVFAHEEIIDGLCKIKIPLIILALISGIAYTVCYFGQNYALEPVNNNVLANLYCGLMIVSILACMKSWFDFETPVSKWMNSRSWGLYICHYLPLAMIAVYLKKYVPNCPALACYLLVGTGTICGGYLMYEVLSRVPFLRWVIFGISKK